MSHKKNPPQAPQSVIHYMPRLHMAQRDGLLYIRSEDIAAESTNQPKVDMVFTRQEAARMACELVTMLATNWDDE